MDLLSQQLADLERRAVYVRAAPPSESRRASLVQLLDELRALRHGVARALPRYRALVEQVRAALDDNPDRRD